VDGSGHVISKGYGNASWIRLSNGKQNRASRCENDIVVNINSL